MNPTSQVKVIVMSFLSILVMVAIIATVSVVTTNALSGEHAEAGEHAEEATEHKMAEHGSEAKPAENKMAEHASEAKPADSKMAEHGTEAKPADSKMAETKTVAASGGNAEAGAKVFVAKTCVTCHMVSKVPEAKGVIGPKLDGLGARAGTRKPGMSADAYIKESIENPTAFVVPTFAPAMPSLRATMNDQEFKDLVAFLHSL